MRLRDIIALYTKARVVSWLTNESRAVFVPTSQGPGFIAAFHNGREVPAEVISTSVPDFPPPDFQPPLPNDGNGEKE